VGRVVRAEFSRTCLQITYDGVSFVTSYFCSQFSLKSFLSAMQPEGSVSPCPLLETVLTIPTTAIYPSMVVFQSSLFVYTRTICSMYFLSIQNAIEYKIGKKPFTSGMLIVRFPVGVTVPSVFQTFQCTQFPVGTGDAYPEIKTSQA
jgi:hypothetical protein